MGVILDVGQPYMEASIELCRIFNAALSDIGYTTSLKLIPNDLNHDETHAWLLSEYQGIAGEIKYTSNATIDLSFMLVEDGHLKHWFGDIINLNEPDSLKKLGYCLKKFALGPPDPSRTGFPIW